MRVAVIGPGAMGILFASRLYDSGAQVTLIDNDTARAASLSASGIWVEEKDGKTSTRRVGATTPDRAGDPFDLAIITVKAPQTESAAVAAAAILTHDGVALTLQNGVGGADILAGSIGPERVLVGVTAQGATLLETGKARHGGVGLTVVGPFARGGTDRTGVAALLEKAGFETRWEDDVLPFVWRKLAVNCGINAITALTGETNSVVHSSPDAARVCSEAVREVWSVAQSLGIDLGDPGHLVAHVLSVAEKTGKNRSSMGQDVDRRRITEIEFINGAVTRYASAAGMAVPVNETLANLVRALEWTFQRRR